MLSPFGLPVPFIPGCRFIRLFRLQTAIITVQLPVAADIFSVRNPAPLPSIQTAQSHGHQNRPHPE